MDTASLMTESVSEEEATKQAFFRLSHPNEGVAEEISATRSRVQGALSVCLMMLSRNF
jgi:hypothetical protein